ncbi:hypothetical protein M9H77_18908 [Catharanthus roseus]|uniref:Uncharacterized protein n=1 Tax=Catharanthus roseus TaxID=4058 RepID=A0ACC0B8V2_CATRO|nr:hypothetical protein M9H77_18908 [Catharanthus roseus]
MTSSPPRPGSAAGGIQNPKQSLGFFANALKRKDSFIQFFIMTGILLLSCRSVGQKYRLHNLQEDTVALKEEQEGLKNRLNNIKQSLLAEASVDPTGSLAARVDEVGIIEALRIGSSLHIDLWCTVHIARGLGQFVPAAAVNVIVPAQAGKGKGGGELIYLNISLEL